VIVAEPTFEEVNEIYLAILLDKPVPYEYPDTEARLRSQIDEIVAAGHTPSIPE